MYGWCDHFHFTVEKTERPEGTKELGQKYTLTIIEPGWHPGLSATKTGADTNFAQQVTYIQSENLAKDKLYF